MATDFAAGPRIATPAERARLEFRVLILQTGLALFYCVGVLTNAFGNGAVAQLVALGWIAPYHAFHAWYVLARRSRGRPVGWIEGVTPIGDISCITLGWIALGDPSSAFWGLYPYALVGYARRIAGSAYWLLTGFVVLSLVTARTTLMADEGIVGLDGNLAVMVAVTLAVATLANLVCSAWRMAEMTAQTMAATDPLTGVANRRTFLRDLEAEAADPNTTISLLMLDLDDFKLLNDEHGHLHGDSVLIAVTRILIRYLGPHDLLARYGGEEFIVAMPGASLAEARLTAERMAAAVRASTPTTVSIGCATRLRGESIESVLRRADDLLLSAKRQGKNTVCTSEPLPKSA